MQEFVHFHRAGNGATYAFYLLLGFVPQLAALWFRVQPGVLGQAVHLVTVTALRDDLVHRVYHHTLAVTGGFTNTTNTIHTQSLSVLHFPVEIIDFLQLSVHVVEVTVCGVETLTRPGEGWRLQD